MAISPATLIAAKGLLEGRGLGVSAKLVGLVDQIQNNPLVSVYSDIANNPNFNFSSVPASVTNLLTNSQSQSSAALNQAKAVFGGSTGGSPASVKSFLGNFSGASAFGSMSAEFHAALSEFQNKSFSDLGINAQGYADVLSGSVTSITQDLTALGAQAAAQTTAQLAGSVGDVAGIAEDAKTSVVSDGLRAVGDGIKNFGTILDFSDVNTLGPGNMVRQLQRRGLAQKYGINQAIADAGYDPAELRDVPDSVLNNVLSTVEGAELQAIIRDSNVQLSQDVQNLAQVLVVENVLPPQAMVAMGLISNAPDMLNNLGNSLTNLGTQLDNFSMADFMQSVETRALKHLSQLTQLIPTDIAQALGPLLGAGSGPFGNPTIKDMLGVAAGIGYNENFQAVAGALESLSNTEAGQNLLASTEAYQFAVANATTEWESAGGLDGTGQTLEDYLAADADVVMTTASVQSAIDAIPGAIGAGIENAIENAAQSLVNVAENLAQEVSNLATAGLELADSIGEGVQTTVLAFSAKLHNLGQDKQGIGYAEFLDQVVTDDVYGDAIKATLMEGRNLARSAAVGKTQPAVANPTKELAKAQSGNLDALKQQYLSAAARHDNATRKLFSPEGKTDPAVNAEYESARDAMRAAQDAMRAAARQASIPESELPKYKSPYQNFTG